MTTAIVFPGQGSQQVGMLQDILQSDHAAAVIVRDTLVEASEYLSLDILKLIQDGPADDLNQTATTQPVLLAADYGLWLAIKNQHEFDGVLFAGHSLGEYAALTAAGVISFEDAVRLARKRGELMQSAVPKGTGAMAAILGLDDQIVIDLAEKACTETEFVSAANFNTSGQIVVAGHKDAVLRLMEAAKDAGAKRAIELPVSVPSHCILMAPAADKMQSVLEDIHFSTPAYTVIPNTTVSPCVDPLEIKKNLIDQLTKPVRWTDTMAHFKSQHVDRIIECGPGKVLQGLCKKYSRDWKLYSSDTVGALETIKADFNA